MGVTRALVIHLIPLAAIAGGALAPWGAAVGAQDDTRDSELASEDDLDDSAADRAADEVAGESSAGGASGADQEARAADAENVDVPTRSVTPPFELPWTDRGPVVRDGFIEASAVGLPHPRIDRWSARRLSARRRGEARAKERIHRWLDDRLAAAMALPMVAERAHALVDQKAEVTGVRALADGAAVVQVALAKAHLRREVPLPGAPWEAAP